MAIKEYINFDELEEIKNDDIEGTTKPKLKERDKIISDKQEKKELVKNVTKKFQGEFENAVNVRVQEITRDIKDDLIRKKEEKKPTTVTYSELHAYLTKGSAMNNAKYTYFEMAVGFDNFVRLTNEISKIIPSHFPTKKQFCSFMGITTRTYDRYANGEDLEMAEVIQKVEDYITDINLTMAQKGLIDSRTTLFSLKAIHGIVEANAPTLSYNVTETVDAKEMKDKLATIRKSIEMKK